MAKTWTVTEAYNAIKTNDKEGISDFGKRFPLATTALAKSGVNDGMDMLMGGMPERVTMRILEMQLKDGVTVSDDDDDDATEEVAEEKPVKAEKKEKVAKAEKAEKTEKKAEKPKKAAKKAEPVEEDDEEDEAPADDTPDYKSMGAVDLFKLCKKRGIKVEPKQKASVYIKALEAADNDSDDEDADEGDDWDI